MAHSASGNGSIRKKEKVVNGKKYTWWEGRFTTGTDPVTGKQLQKSVSGKTQKEVAAKLKAATVAVDNSTYIPQEKTLAADWVRIWLRDYCNSIEASTRETYDNYIEKHIAPGLGKIQLGKLTAHQVQSFYNSLSEKGLSPKTVKNVHGILHKALKQAKRENLIHDNPADFVDLPKVSKPDVSALSPSALLDYLDAAKVDPFCNLFTVAIFSGMRQGEILGLTWDHVDFKAGTVEVCQQLQRVNKEYTLKAPKWGSSRVLFPAKIVMDALAAEQAHQSRCRTENPDIFDNPLNLVFTDETGKLLVRRTVDKHHEKILERAGIPHARFHDLRHSYAVVSLLAGDDVKTLQGNLGHSNSQTTLDTYSHVIDLMKQRSSSRVQTFVDEQIELHKKQKQSSTRKQPG